MGCRNQAEFIKVWAHECIRVFQDRLIDSHDQLFFESLLKQKIKENFHQVWVIYIVMVGHSLSRTAFVGLVFALHLPERGRLQTSLVRRILWTGKPIFTKTDLDLLNRKTNEILSEYNQYYSSNRMDLVLFMNAIQHIMRIVRILQTPLGHALLVGVGGSGRK